MLSSKEGRWMDDTSKQITIYNSIQSVASYSFLSRRGPRSPGSPVTRRSLLSSAGGWLSCDIICGGSAPCDQGAETGHRRLLMPVTVLKLKQRHFYASDQWSFQFCPSRRWGKLLDYWQMSGTTTTTTTLDRLHRPYITPALYYTGPILHQHYITLALYYTGPILHPPYL